QVKVVVCLVERQLDKCLEHFNEIFDEIILAKDLQIENFESFIFRYDVVEACTAVKGQLFKFLLDNYSDEKIVYLDPDIKVYGSLSDLEGILDEHEIVLTPHLCEPEDKDNIGAIIDNEISSLRYGVFNLGFLAIRRGETSRKFINWWTDRLDLYCYDNMIEKGLFTDQKWIDLAPCFFDVYILKHPGYNVATWNITKRNITEGKNGKYFVNGKPLVFYHFSGFDSGANEVMLQKYIKNSSHPIYKMRNKYIEEMNFFGQEELGKFEWSYGYFENGEKIQKQTRVRFRNSELFKELFPNPFLE
ncbi:hypothetical protein, partial [Geobacillus sp. ZGt-1]|uniref:hypothetical protein n=1 Tax=Geobacillus sp. ZGt-1 TaxID=1631556 RepID=UPI0006497EEE